MKKYAFLLGLLLSVFCLAPATWGGQIKAYVSEFAVTGAQNKDELKVTLQTLLMSRLSSEEVLAVDSPAGADITVTGSYVVFGKIFSMDAVAKNSAGSVITRAFMQGDSQDELIPAVGKLAQSLTDGITRNFTPAPAKPALTVPTAPIQAPATPDIVRQKVVVAPTSDIIRPEQVAKTASSGWVSQRLTGALVGIAPGRTLENGMRELFIVDAHTLRLYRQEEKLTLVAETAFAAGETILSLDTADMDRDGMPEAYVTVYNGYSLASQVWTVKGSTLVRAAEKLPYFFRGIALAGKEKKIYAQQMSSDADFYGDVFELVKAGDKYELQNPIKLPRFGYLYNFNIFTDNKGKDYFAVLNSDGYIIIYSDGEELWRSSEKFGGSESYFKREDLTNLRTTGDAYRWIFLDPRITATKEGDIIVPQNSGFFVLGNSRSYSKNSVFCFGWNGSTLDEKWHTKLSQNYLADYFYDEARKELVFLEVVKKEGLIKQGASMVSIKKVE